MSIEMDRRSVLKATGTAAAFGLGGCLGGGKPDYETITTDVLHLKTQDVDIPGSADGEEYFFVAEFQNSRFEDSHVDFGLTKVHPDGNPAYFTLQVRGAVRPSPDEPEFVGRDAATFAVERGENFDTADLYQRASEIDREDEQTGVELSSAYRELIESFPDLRLETLEYQDVEVKGDDPAYHNHDGWAGYADISLESQEEFRMGREALEGPSQLE